MKLWQALCLVLIVLVGTESLVDRKGETSALESAQTRLAERAASGTQSNPAISAEAPRAKTANLKTWFSPDDAADGSELAEISDGVSSSGDYAEAQDAPGGPSAIVPLMGEPDQTRPAADLSSSGMAISPPQARLIERAS